MNQQEQEQLFYQQMLDQQNQINNFDLYKTDVLRNPQPTTNYETAVYLLSNSETTKELSEIEKEIKLSNLNQQEKQVVLSLLETYQDQILLNDLQFQKYKSYIFNLNNKQKIKEFDSFLKEYKKSKFDKLNTLRRAFSIASASRGYNGFERNSQNTTIQNSNLYQNESPSIQQKKNSFSKIFGGLN